MVVVVLILKIIQYIMIQDVPVVIHQLVPPPELSQLRQIKILVWVQKHVWLFLNLMLLQHLMQDMMLLVLVLIKQQLKLNLRACLILILHLQLSLLQLRINFQQTLTILKINKINLLPISNNIQLMQVILKLRLSI